MLKEAGSFFAIAFLLLVGACVYIESQGGKPFAHQSPLQGGTCAYQDYRCMARQDATNNGISADLFVAQINQESGFNPDAISPAGAIGIAQIMPSTGSGWGVDPHDPVASLSAAASAMAQYNNQYGSYQKALAAYNCGTACVNTAIARYGANWRTGIPAETDRYIRAIMGV
jgi:soluble lytic murein transglycosylase-like protein